MSDSDSHEQRKGDKKRRKKDKKRQKKEAKKAKKRRKKEKKALGLDSSSEEEAHPQAVLYLGMQVPTKADAQELVRMLFCVFSSFCSFLTMFEPD